MTSTDTGRLRTRTQRLALIAFDEVNKQGVTKESRSFALSFPTLVHTCGLCQAVAFANTKKEIGRAYLEVLARALMEIGHTTATDRSALSRAILTMGVGDYIRISRDSLIAANFIKRYVEAAYTDTEKGSIQ